MELNPFYRKVAETQRGAEEMFLFLSRLRAEVHNVSESGITRLRDCTTPIETAVLSADGAVGLRGAKDPAEDCSRIE